MKVKVTFDDSWDEESIINAFVDNDQFPGVISVLVVPSHCVKCKNESNESEEWISVEKELPSTKNGYVDCAVLVAVKNKNKEDGIYLQDMCSFDGEQWMKRTQTWERITHWRPLPENPSK